MKGEEDIDFNLFSQSQSQLDLLKEEQLKRFDDKIFNEKIDDCNLSSALLNSQIFEPMST